MEQKYPIVLFDGECNLCNGVVRNIVPRDPTHKLRFANLQSETGIALLEQYSLPTDILDSFILIDEDKAYQRSDGALRIFRYLHFPWSIISRVLSIVPQSLRDSTYHWIARNRYAWFGKTDYCQSPSQSLEARFLP